MVYIVLTTTSNILPLYDLFLQINELNNCNDYFKMLSYDQRKKYFPVGDRNEQVMLL